MKIKNLFMKSLICLSALSFFSVRAATTDLFVTPTGSGNVCTDIIPCSLQGAKDKVRTLNTTMTGDIHVMLHGGIYTLTQPILFEPLDNGKNGFKIVYQAVGNERPTISGGANITGWTLTAGDKGIYQAKVPSTLMTRQLFINGVRGIRARSEKNPSGFNETSTGYHSNDASMANWKNKTDIEIIHLVEWKSFRCDVASIQGNDWTMDQPCWSNAHFHPGATMKEPTWIENAFELLDQPGEWYLDRAAAIMYYKPRAGENMATASVVAPVLESLFGGKGTAQQPVANLEFRGLTFSFATWLEPNTVRGYPTLQSGERLVGDKNTDPNALEYDTEIMPANVDFQWAHGIRFEGNLFTYLGAAALNLGPGSQGNFIIGNCFKDISHSAIQIGDVHDRLEKDATRFTSGNEASNNYITDIGVEYHDAVGIFVGYCEKTTLLHNEMHELPYSGISIGWGWGLDSYANNNKANYNLIYNLMTVLRDGGGVYTLSGQPSSEVAYNYIHDQKNEFGSLYPDEGTKFFHWHHNVIGDVTRWLWIWTPTIQQNVVDYNYYNTNVITNDGKDNTVENNTFVNGSAWPTEAQKIMTEAGLQPSYAALRNLSDATTGLQSSRQSRYSKNKLGSSINECKSKAGKFSPAFNFNGNQFNSSGRIHPLTLFSITPP